MGRKACSSLSSEQARLLRCHGLESYGASDYFIHFAEEFRPAKLKSRLLRIPLVDTRVFKPPAFEASAKDSWSTATAIAQIRKLP